MSQDPNDCGRITKLLKAVSEGSPAAMDKLVPLVYDELRRQAHLYLKKERKNHTLQTTALVHEAYLRLVDQRNVSWQNRAHFFGVSATMMRRILVNYAKKRNRIKRGGPNENLPLDEAMCVASKDREIDLLALDKSLDDLSELDKQQARIVELRYFSGLTIKETAEVLRISAATVKRDWKMAKTWLRAELKDLAAG
ncbi:MAG: sigma-70 family RNA polymerase sigma factor [Pyrinomonadaceae bacterium]|nr:sigma-70 family RNA polymerase sigma factor [Pyrinomonadaceae bacterium]